MMLAYGPGMRSIIRHSGDAPALPDLRNLATTLRILLALNAAVEAHPKVSLGSYPQYEGGKERVILTLDSRDRGELTRALDTLRRLLL